MIFNAAFWALQRLWSPQFRTIFWKSLGYTIGLLVFLWFFLRQIFIQWVFPWLAPYFSGMPDWLGWLGIVWIITFSFGLAAILALLVGPITALIGGLFIDDVAEIVEKQDYSQEEPGKAMPLGRSMIIAARFLCLSIIGNIIALLLLLVPGVNLIGFFVINGYLLGREYFEFAASRFRAEKGGHDFYVQNRGTVFCAGLIIALFLSIPILNLLTPLFAAAMMTYLHKSLSGSKRETKQIKQYDSRPR
ncbi:sulfate transporter family protein [Bartonella sp. HY329]|uniref:sulfate transporter family protein n=1 Tax=unclassified Bartonella TaxID=2645622 RepID=UPI0021CA739F|nr:MULTISPECIES: sulfate transporter family protein [unclassified Bartonella]UXM95822.1 sulfate transporter family protein [Bartonella sp. HY329]UXN10147.1 sulfate transporter family protein [Bartonella sp. HY328]